MSNYRVEVKIESWEQRRVRTETFYVKANNFDDAVTEIREALYSINNRNSRMVY